ncbi:MAG TPA: long-chain fatty acid--CoA ligase [Gemmatimonadales bacterium]|nr:long-chain fatty acid--CoA ligase [Gemmatimonadales bacterium]HRX17527.1 long-chain fatty acid--CoA ligase [Gemmatimonadales bacterium]
MNGTTGRALGRPGTLTALFFAAIRRHRELPAALRSKVDGSWRAIRHDELLERVRHVHAGFRDLGLVPGDRVAILSENRPEWAITDYACLAARCVDVPVYPTLPAQQIAYILRDSGARVVCCSTAAQVEKVLEIRDAVPALEQVILFDEGPIRDGVRSFREFERHGAAAAPRWPDWEAEALEAEPDDLATLIYTSGTTGDPKGVMLTHGNIASNVVAALDVLDLRGGECLSFLPLSHIFERMVGHYTMLHGGVTISYATSHETVAAELLEIRPTLLASVPRLYEKIYARVVEKATGGGALTRAIFEWARATGLKHLEYRLEGTPPSWALRLGQRIADLLVFSKLRAGMGGRFRFCVSGGAPLNPDIARFFLAAGLPILEGYGLTETSPVITVNPLERIKPGTVGPPLPGVEIRIADDGEILCRGPNVMRGYFGKPEATAEAIDPDGWFHTGDIGEIDADGYLRITDRKKDLIVTAGGKNIAPQPIEALLKTNPFIANAVMLGDKRRFPIMLLVPNFERVRAWAVTEQIAAADDEALVEVPAVREKIEREARKSFRDLAQYETPKKFLVLPRDFTIASGELTPKMSVKRKVVEQHWQASIDALYAEEHP